MENESKTLNVCIHAAHLINASSVGVPIKQDKQFSPFATPRERHSLTMQGVNESAMKHLGAVLQILGLSCEAERSCFVCNRTWTDGSHSRIFVERCLTGQWEYEDDIENTSLFHYGDTVISLTMHLCDLTTLQACALLKKIVNALESGSGYERIPLFWPALIEGAEQRSIAHPDATDAPDSLGMIDYLADFHPIHTHTGDILGCISSLYFPGQVGGPLGFCRPTYLVLTRSQHANGTYTWQNKLPKPPYPLYGQEKLANNPNMAVVLVNEIRNTNYAEILLAGIQIKAIGLSFFPAIDSVELTDLSQLEGRVVYVMGLTPDMTSQVKQKLRIRNRRTKVSVVRLHAEQVNPQIEIEGGALQFGKDSCDWNVRDFYELLHEREWKVHVSTSPLNMIPERLEFDGFFVCKDGVFSIKYKDGEAIHTHIASRINVVAHARNEDSAEWGVLIELPDMNGVIHEWCIPRGLLAGSTLFAQMLLSLGAYVSPEPKDRMALCKYLLTAPQTRLAKSVFRPGWSDFVFVFPDGSHIGNSDELISYQTADPTGNVFGQSGSLQSWNTHVAALCRGNSRLALAIGVGLAGPLLRLLGEENGGFHLFGNSSCGKTTAAYVTCCIWGKPEAFITRWRSTVNGIEARATLHNDTVMVLDELSQIPSVDAGNGVYMIGNGQGKMRAQQDGSAKTPSSWQFLFLSTGEIGLDQHMAAGGQKAMAGQQTRLVDLPADAGCGLGIFDTVHDQAGGESLSRLLKDESSHNYGTVGRAFVTALADPHQREQILMVVRSRILDFCATNTPPASHGQVSRSIRRFALVAAAMESCIDLGILLWNSGEASALIQRCCLQWLEARGGVGNAEANQALQQLRSVLVERGESGFTEIGLNGIEASAPNRVTFQRLGFRELAADGLTDFYILPDAFRSVIFVGMNPRQVTKDLVRANALVLDPQGKPQTNKRLPGMGTTRIYHVRSEILNEQDGASIN